MKFRRSVFNVVVSTDLFLGSLFSSIDLFVDPRATFHCPAQRGLFVSRDAQTRAGKSAPLVQGNE